MGPDAAQVIEIYQRHALEWSRDRRDRLVEQRGLDRFVPLLPAPHREVLDIRCGAGVPIARYLIEQGCQVSGADSSSTMIKMCAHRFPEHQWHVADMRTLALDRTFGGILAWDSLFHLSPGDQRGMFPIFRQHAAPGAMVMFTSGPLAGEQIGSYQGERLYHASLDSAEYRKLLGENGFDVIAHVAADASCGMRTVWFGRLR